MRNYLITNFCLIKLVVYYGAAWCSFRPKLIKNIHPDKKFLAFSEMELSGSSIKNLFLFSFVWGKGNLPKDFYI